MPEITLFLPNMLGVQPRQLGRLTVWHPAVVEKSTGHPQVDLAAGVFGRYYCSWRISYCWLQTSRNATDRVRHLFMPSNTRNDHNSAFVEWIDNGGSVSQVHIVHNRTTSPKR